MFQSYSKRKLVVDRTKLWIIYIFVLTTLILDVGWIIGKVKEGAKLPAISYASFIILLVALVIFVYLINLFFNKIDKITTEIESGIENAKDGLKGENLVFDALVKIINPVEYKIFRNVVLPGKKWDIDFIILGPKGLCVIEVKNYSTRTVFTYNDAQLRSKYGVLGHFIRDSRWQVYGQVTELEKYLREKNILNFKIDRSLLYVNSESVELKESKNKYNVYVIKGISGLNKYYSDMFLKPKFTPKFREKVSSVLLELKLPEVFDKNFLSGSKINFIK
ncbi:MAG: nuclease-related domain-containing protein [Patescibacteria group bacterium]|jgi:hypothetical protein